ncbi:MAG: acyl-CoA dehydrogenase family protein [Bacteroidia bacterium]|nr:acyl-CoA dehydrogenase family protein [Bacteroidia bacterium]MDW8015944.1 acyl-CoA dehydrogenase family protein [Bacteroidia bacterium]
MAQSRSIVTDYFDIEALYTPEQRTIRDTVRQWVESRLKPIIDDYAQRAECPIHLVPEMAQLGVFGPFIPEEYGGAGLDYISYGLIMQEIEAGDSGIRSIASVQSSLVMYPIWKFGSDYQRQYYLPRLARGEIIGCFGLTEPNHGSNPAGMESYFYEEGDSYVVTGRKMWISNAPFADIAIVWAKGPDGQVRGLILERGMEGFSTPELHRKWSLRASATGELVMEKVRVPKQNLLPGVVGLRGPLSCLNSARYGIAWGAIGAALDCYRTAVQYSLERVQFGKPIAAFQLTQKKLAEMLTEITKAQLLAFRLGQLMNEGRATPQQISMAKRNNVAMALEVARTARQILGGMGIMGDYPIMRHMMNLESVITYEGTHEIHLLITGEDITGISAFV